MKLFKIIKILYDDKKQGIQNRNDRVTVINHLLGLKKIYYTPKYKLKSDNEYIVEYSRFQFWYDSRPITLKAIWRCFGNWHVMLWRTYKNGGKCGYVNSTVRGRFSKKKIYEWLKIQSKIYDEIITKIDPDERIDNRFVEF